MNNLIESLQNVCGLHFFKFDDKIVFYGDTSIFDESLQQTLVEHKDAMLSALPEGGGQVEMNFCQRSMALDDLYQGSGSRNSVVLLLSAAYVIDEPTVRGTIDWLCRCYPLLDAEAEIDGERFCFRIQSRPSTQRVVIDQRDYETEKEFVTAQEQNPCCLFEGGLLKMIGGIINGKRRWALCLHHAVFDGPFLTHLLGLLAGAITARHQPDIEADFNFIQQNWHLEQTARASREEMESYWRQQRALFSEADLTTSNFRPLEPEVCTVNWELGKDLSAQLMTALESSQSSMLDLSFAAFAHGLAVDSPKRSFVALTTLSLRSDTGTTPCSGFFTNLVPILLQPGSEECESSSPLQVVSRIGAKLREAFDHGLLPYEQIRDLACIDHSAPLAIINLLPREEPSAVAKYRGLIVEPAQDKIRRPFKLTIVGSPRSEWMLSLSSSLSKTRLTEILDRMKDFILMCGQVKA